MTTYPKNMHLVWEYGVTQWPLFGANLQKIIKNIKKRNCRISNIALIYADMLFEHAFDLRSEHFLTSKQMTTLFSVRKSCGAL